MLRTAMRLFRIGLLLSAGAIWGADPGPAIGVKAPDFELSDQNGQMQTLRSLSGPKGLMLVFFRSADW